MMRINNSRKLFLFGRYSLAILLPKKWLSLLEAKRGERVILELNLKRRRIVIRFSSESTPASNKPIKTKADPDDKTDWEPIPQI